jgi:uncharacterized protein (DUF305 family)
LGLLTGRVTARVTGSQGEIMDVKPKDKKLSGQKKFVAFLILLLLAVSLSLIFFKEEPAGALSKSEINFLTMMIPHHEQALEMTDLVYERSEDPEIRSLADQISQAQGPEIAQMKSWLQSAGIKEIKSSDHMHGMLTEKEMQELKNSSGLAFDKLFLQGMIRHHQGAIDMVSLTAGSKKLESFGAEIFSAQKLEIDEMRKILLGK